MGGRRGAWGCQTEPWGDAETRASLCSVIMLSPFHDGATHWSNRIVRLRFISNGSFVMTALPFWRGMLVRHDTDQEPGAVARRIENNPGWLNDASLLEACFAWARDVMFDAVYQEGNSLCVKGSQLDRTWWLRWTQIAHDTLCGWQSTIKCWGGDLWWLLWARLMQTPCTRQRPVGQRPPRRIVPSVFLFPVLVPRTCWQRPGWHTHNTKSTSQW